MYRLLFLRFIRSKTTIAALALIMIIGIGSIIMGRQFLAKQQKTIAEVTAYQRDHIQRHTHFQQNDIGLLMYYLRFALVNKPAGLAALSIGQRDINLPVQSVTIRNLEAQKYDTDLNNPYNQLSGYLDLGFVIIYLFPLLIITLTFNLLSEEKEAGTWQLVAAQSTSLKRFIIAKLLLRTGTVLSVVLLLLLIATVLLPLKWNTAFVLFAATSIAYILFWMALCFLAVTFKKNSGFNALALLSCWIMLTVLLPAAVNNFIAGKYPVPEALRTMVKQRDGYHTSWDIDKRITMNKFYAHYPQLEKYPLPNTSFSWQWYYAMWQMGDDEVVQDARQMREKLQLRESAGRTAAFFIPTMHTQLQLNDLAQTSLANHLHFLDSTTRFHEKMRLYFYPKIFENAAIAKENWSRFTPEYFSEPLQTGALYCLLPLLVFILLLSGVSAFNVNRLT